MSSQLFWRFAEELSVSVICVPQVIILVFAEEVSSKSAVQECQEHVSR